MPGYNITTMGQRTQIIVRLTNRNGETRTRAYHYQWGFAKVMPIEFISVVTGLYYTRDIFDMFSLLSGDDLTDMKWNIDDKEVCIANELKTLRLEPAAIGVITEERFDNNNGVMVIEAKEVTDNGITYGIQYKIGFLKGTGDSSRAFTSWVSARTYMSQWKEFSPLSFIKIFEAFCEYFDIESFNNNNNGK